MCVSRGFHNRGLSCGPVVVGGFNRSPARRGTPRGRFVGMRPDDVRRTDGRTVQCVTAAAGPSWLLRGRPAWFTGGVLVTSGASPLSAVFRSALARWYRVLAVEGRMLRIWAVSTMANPSQWMRRTSSACADDSRPIASRTSAPSSAGRPSVGEVRRTSRNRSAQMSRLSTASANACGFS